MRIVRTWVMIALMALPWTATLQVIDANPGIAIAQEQQPAPGKSDGPDIDVNIDGGGEKRYVVWFSNPLILAVGGIAVLLVLMLIMMAARGGGTTVIKE